MFFANDMVPGETDILGLPLMGVNNACSVKDAVRFASGNNLMGLICPSALLVGPPSPSSFALLTEGVIGYGASSCAEHQGIGTGVGGTGL